MRFIADFHIHSHYSMATSKECCPEQLSQWARLKGLTVIGTGDFTHPGWMKELKGKLQPAQEEGLYELKPEYAKPFAHTCKIPVTSGTAAEGDAQKVRFLLSAEISSIYKKNGRVRKIHNLLLVPDIASAEKINTVLDRFGNIRSDGRPILGMDSRHLLEIVLDCCPQVSFIPAHIWTPHFSLLGSRSGFDSLEECFEDLSGHIFALETGLSSDPAMNWRLSALDRYALVSNSDAHSPKNLAREANCFKTELSYAAIRQALKTKDPEAFLGTIEFYPEEGKYHYDGHRACQICWSPEETMAAAGICPRCGRKVTIGVMYRAVELADRPPGGRPDRVVQSYESVVPLLQILAEFYQVGENSKKVQQAYFQLLGSLGSELEILRSVPLEEIRSQSSALLAEGVRRVREGEVKIRPGFDGEYGKVRLFDDGERQKFKAQTSLFGLKSPAAGEDSSSVSGKSPFHEAGKKPFHTAEKKPSPAGKNRIEGAVSPEPPTPPLSTPECGISTIAPLESATVPQEGQRHKPALQEGQKHKLDQRTWLDQLNEEQRECITSSAGPVIIIAGPGTGKTRTLVCRIAHMLQFQKILPEHILAITFTNKAAQELKARIRETLPSEIAADGLITGTFHHFCLSILQEEEARAKSSEDAGNAGNAEDAKDTEDVEDTENKDTNHTKTLINEQDALLLIREVLAGYSPPDGCRRIQPQRLWQWISKVKSRAWALDLPAEEFPEHLPLPQLPEESSLRGQPSPPPWIEEAVADFAQELASGEEHLTGRQFSGEQLSSGQRFGEQLWSLCLAYQRLLHRYRAYDYDDVLLKVVKLLQSDPKILQKYRSRITRILVDEFQDVNEIQYLLVKLLASDGAGLVVIGDPDQAIYSFRGADYRFFSRLQDDFPGHRLFHLKENYRSSADILKAAGALIRHNPDRFPLELKPHRQRARRETGGIQLHFVGSEQAEGITVVREITRMMGGVDMLQAHGQHDQRQGTKHRQTAQASRPALTDQTVQTARRTAQAAQAGLRIAPQGNHAEAHPQEEAGAYPRKEAEALLQKEEEGDLGFSDFAVLFRTGQQAAPLEECFLREGIPYRVVGQKSFLQSPGVQTVVAMLRFLINPEDDFSLWNLLHRWGDAAFSEPVAGRRSEHFQEISGVCQRLQEIASINHCSFFSAVRQGTFSAAASEKLQCILSLQDNYHSRVRENKGNVSQLIADLIEQEIRVERSNDPDMERLYQCSMQFSSITEFVHNLLLFRDGDLEYRGMKTPASGEAVSLMTIHAAKGLEFPVIFICGLEDGLLPYDHLFDYVPAQSHNSFNWSHTQGHSKNEVYEKEDRPNLQKKLQMEEERRLFYVALTRAKDELVLISSRHRWRYNQRRETRPSSFLTELPADVITRVKKSLPARTRQLRLF
ncbi:MAG: UvrD-helicase domain-containing protein [bacterium]